MVNSMFLGPLPEGCLIEVEFFHHATERGFDYHLRFHRFSKEGVAVWYPYENKVKLYTHLYDEDGDVTCELGPCYKEIELNFSSVEHLFICGNYTGIFWIMRTLLEDNNVN